MSAAGGVFVWGFFQGADVEASEISSGTAASELPPAGYTSACAAQLANSKDATLLLVSGGFSFGGVVQGGVLQLRGGRHGYVSDDVAATAAARCWS